MLYWSSTREVASSWLVSSDTSRRTTVPIQAFAAAAGDKSKHFKVGNILVICSAASNVMMYSTHPLGKLVQRPERRSKITCGATTAVAAGI